MLSYIQVNYPGIKYLVFDCDYEGSALRAQKLYIPGPTLSVVNAKNGHSHLFDQILE